MIPKRQINSSETDVTEHGSGEAKWNPPANFLNRINGIIMAIPSGIIRNGILNSTTTNTGIDENRQEKIPYSNTSYIWGGMAFVFTSHRVIAFAAILIDVFY